MNTQSSLSQFATKLAAKNHFVKASFAGFSGTGKSRTSSEFVAGTYKALKCTKPILFIDNEKGSRFLVPFFKKQGIEVLVKDTTSLADVITSMEYLQKGEIDFLFVDSLSKVWYQYVSDYKAKNKITFMTLEHWGKILPAWQQEFSDRFVGLEGNFVFTGRGGNQYEKEEDTQREDGSTKKGAFVKSGVKMKLAGETPFEPDLNVWMEMRQVVSGKTTKVYREAQIMKDRSATIDGKIFKNPTFKEFKPFVDFILDTPLGEVAGATDTLNHAPSEDFEYQKRKNAREIELEKIKASFEKIGFGVTREEKQLKVMIYEKIFGTSSMTEFEKFDAEKLRAQREMLEQLFDGLITAEDKIEYVKSFSYSKTTKENPLGL
jgi:AAA domain